MKLSNKNIIVSFIAIKLLTVFFISSCHKFDPEPPVGILPMVNSLSVINITSTTVFCSAEVISQGGSSVTSRGVCWDVNPNPTIDNEKIVSGQGEGKYSGVLSSLIPNQTYYLRAYATNANGTGYGEDMLLKTNDIVIDIDSNMYETVTIGTQTWMSENLSTTRYNDGTNVAYVSDNAQWGGLASGAWCHYNNNGLFYENRYGKLYNWHAVSDTAGLCPSGWRVPNDADWNVLISNLGGTYVAGGKLKSAGVSFWTEPNTGGTNESGFNALPGGLRNYLGIFNSVNNLGYWWSSTSHSTGNAWHITLGFDYAAVGKNYSNEKAGFSVRCLKN